ncbi:transglycosylase SLT domain-containing protein [Thalassomonas actiniarum]|uniref:Transglycosylase SLT domain-containing protein n=2 Tax=Thalassomonas actiniarum TaxID=485447 RepID=A0AAE9YQ36_9GAMM|nr:transglycosylase SLT domain-containing protein [Thalassomonas actiniarum]
MERFGLGRIMLLVGVMLLPIQESQATRVQTTDPQRKIYLQAEKHLWHPASAQYQELYQQLHFYPLQPYLDQQRLIKRLNLKHQQEIDKFLTTYKGTPLDWPLRKKWLQYLAKRKQQALFLKYYTPTSDVALQCQQLRYRLNAGHSEKEVLAQVTKLWLVGKSQDKKCDPLFKRWQEAGYRTPDIVWQRLSLAANGGKHTLIPYLTGLLPESERYLGCLWHKVRRDPAYITRIGRFKEKSAKEAQIMTYGLKRLIWRAPKRALATYQKASKLFAFTEEQDQEIIVKFALALSSKNHKQAQVWLDKVAESSLSNTMIQWRLAQVLKQKDSEQLKSELVALPEQYKSELKWKYWYARSLIDTGNVTGGESLLQELAKERHYYGFLAAGYLKLPVNLQDKPLEISEQEKAAVLTHLAAKRAFELFYLQRFNQARREWNYWLSQLNDREKLVASKVAYEAGWFDRAIFTLAQVGYLDDVDLRFPLAFDNKIIEHAKNNQINPAWAFAITRRESSFMTDANSSAGAKGLMQLMPNTAKHLEKRKVSKKYLLDADNNIGLGTKYLKMLLDKNKGNSILATASYNAGPHRVKRWLKDSVTLPADAWIETIPFKETRDYVKSVLAYQQIYQAQVGQEGSLFDDLSDMHISD